MVQFTIESLGERRLKIGQYLTKLALYGVADGRLVEAIENTSEQTTATVSAHSVINSSSCTQHGCVVSNGYDLKLSLIDCFDPSDVNKNLRHRGQTGLEAKILASASSIWLRSGLGLVNLAWKMCCPMQNNIGCIHFVVVSLQHSLQSHGTLYVGQKFSYVLLLKKKKKKNLFFAQKPNIKMNKHVNKVRKATGRAEAITAGRQQNKQ